MARTDRSRIEVFPVEGGFKMQRFDKYGRKAASTDKVFTLRNNTRREARKICKEKNLGNIPIVSVKREQGSDESQEISTNGHQPNDTAVASEIDYVPIAAEESAVCAD